MYTTQKEKSNFKNKLIKFFSEDFWFQDERENKAEKRYIEDIKEESLKTINILELKKRKNISSNKNEINIERENKSIKDLDFKQLTISENLENPQGYIKLFLKDITIDQLFLKHNITLKYLNIGNNLFIKSFILGNESKEIDCYNVGENESLTIEKHNNSIINIKLKETLGNEESLSVVNGIVLN